MPTTLSGLLLFVALLTPGFCFALRRERVVAAPTVSVFRETVALVFASVAALAIAVGLFTFVRLLLPDHTPNVGQFVRAPSDYAKQEYAYVALWSVGTWLTACLLASIAARPPASLSRVMRRDPQAIERFSAWWRLFEANPSLEKTVLCQLDDGTTVEGWLWSYDPDPEETGDRELVLTGPLVLRHPNGHVQRTDYGAISMSARRMVYMYVNYSSRPI
jgi:Family of unknown function (DUF6338)